MPSWYRYSWLPPVLVIDGDTLYVLSPMLRTISTKKEEILWPWFPCHRGDFWNVCDSCSYANVWNRELDKPCLDFFENFWAEIGHRILHLPRHYSRLSVLMAVSYITSSGEETLLCLQMSLLWLTPAPLWPVRISTVFLLSSNAYSWFLSRNIHCLTRAKLHTSCTAEILNKAKEAQFNLKLLSSALIIKSLCKI